MLQQAIESIAAWAYSTPPAEWIRSTRWGVPTLSVVHVFGLILLLSSVLMTTLRCFGLVWQRDAVSVIVRTLAPVTLTGLVVMTISGSLLFASGADRYATSSAFEVKMVAYVLAITMQSLAYVMAVRDKSRDHRATPRTWTIIGGVLFLLWLSVGISGRFIAFY